MKRKYKAAIWIAAGSALVLTVGAYLIWGKKPGATPAPIKGGGEDGGNTNNNNNNTNNNIGYQGGGYYTTTTNPPVSYPPNSDPNSFESYIVTTSSANLNVRSAPNTSATIVASLPKNELKIGRAHV